MIIQRDIWVDDLHYILKFHHYCFSFSLVHPPKHRLSSFKKSKSELLFFYDDPHYEDLNIRAPALQIFNLIVRHMDEIIRQYKIQYWVFSATSIKKARIYAKLLDRYIGQKKIIWSYLQDGLDFYVYPQF